MLMPFSASIMKHCECVLLIKKGFIDSRKVIITKFCNLTVLASVYTYTYLYTF